MDITRLMVSQAALWFLAACRLGGFVVASPFPGDNVPTMQRMGLVATLAWVVATTAPTTHLPTTLGPALFVAIFVETAIGLILGVTFRFVFAAADVLGQTLAHGTGLAAPSVMNPALGASDTPLGRAITLLAILLGLAMGAHRVALLALLQSFRAVPLGSGVDLTAALGPMVDLSAQTIMAGVRLAFPVTGVAIVVQLSLAMIARAAPTLQVFNIGFGVTMATGAAVLLQVIPDMGMGLGDQLDTLHGRLELVLHAIALP